MALLQGDCLDVLKTLDAASIDACVTDPPYGIGFMGREWDTFKPGQEQARIVPNKAIESDNPNLKGRTRGPASSPSAVEYDYSAKGLREFQKWTEGWAREVYRVLRPGSHIVVCGAPRAYHRMASGLEDAGFEIRDCLAWLFGSGFPKSLNLGEGLGTALKPAHEPIVLARKPFKGTVKANVETHGTGALNIDACRVEAREQDDYGRSAARADGFISKTRNSSDYGLKETDAEYASDLGRWPANVCLDDLAAMVLDEQSGELMHSAGAARDGSTAKVADSYAASSYELPPNRNMRRLGDEGGASRFYKICTPDCILCDAPTDDREIMSGCKSTSVSIAEARSETIRRIVASIAPATVPTMHIELIAHRVLSAASLCATCATFTALTLVEIKRSDSKRPESVVFPASIPSYKSSILSRSLVSFAGLWASIDTIPTTASLSLLFGSVAHAIDGCTRPESLESASDQPRFLYSAKPSREERDYGLESLSQRSGGALTFREDGSAGLRSPRAGAGRNGNARNFHPTVKPVELMRWLIRLVTPINGVVLDPFLGSGTTGMAARYEQRRFIGIEREAEYMQIAERRIAAVTPLFSEQSA
jgi:DNA modification methylase